MENNELQHAGVKNMKWGIRRWQNKDGSLTPAGRERYAKKKQEVDADTHEDHIKARAKSASSMSDKELQDAIARLQREKLYSDLTQPKVSKGREIGNKILTKIGDKALEVAVNKLGEHVFNKAADAVFETAKRKTKATIGQTAEGRKYLRKYGNLWAGNNNASGGKKKK
jgi:hypothetical protein